MVYSGTGTDTNKQRHIVLQTDNTHNGGTPVFAGTGRVKYGTDYLCCL